MTRLRPQASGLILVVLLAGCEQVSTDTVMERPAVVTPSFRNDVAPILAETCASSGACHFGPSAQRGLELSPDSSYANLVNQLSSCCGILVAPGNSAGSFLVNVLSDDINARGGYPWRMPLTERPVSAGVRQTIVNWIDQGAPDN